MNNSIRADRMKMVAESSILLNEEEVKYNEQINNKNKVKSSKIPKQQKMKGAFNRFNNLVNSTMKKSDQQLINGPTGTITELVKIAITSTGLAFVAGLQTVIPYIVYRFMKTEVNQSKRKELLSELRTNLKVVEAQLEDMNKIHSPTKEEKDEKYKLVKTKSILDQNIKKLERKVGKEG